MGRDNNVYLQNEKLLNEISSNSITTIKQFYDQNEFFNKIYQLI